MTTSIGQGQAKKRARSYRQEQGQRQKTTPQHTTRRRQDKATKRNIIQSHDKKCLSQEKKHDDRPHNTRTKTRDKTRQKRKRHGDTGCEEIFLQTFFLHLLIRKK
jgi:hypothetical protein